MSRQFGLKRSSAAQQSTSTAPGKCASEARQPATRDEATAPRLNSPPLVPLYAPASWRGKSDRRCISAD
jgi:hypothetical protein